MMVCCCDTRSLNAYYYTCKFCARREDCAPHVTDFAGSPFEINRAVSKQLAEASAAGCAQLSRLVRLGRASARPIPALYEEIRPCLARSCSPPRLRLDLVTPSALVSDGAEYKAWLPPVRWACSLLEGIGTLTGHLDREPTRFASFLPGSTSSTRRLVCASYLASPSRSLQLVNHVEREPSAYQ